MELFNHKNLDGWEVIGDGVWHVLSDGTLMGERDLRPVLRDAPFLRPAGSAIATGSNVHRGYTRSGTISRSSI